MVIVAIFARFILIFLSIFIFLFLIIYMSNMHINISSKNIIVYIVNAKLLFLNSIIPANV